jgi:hypothetical protein
MASAHFASVSTEQIEKIVQDKDSENLKILNNKIIIEFGSRRISELFRPRSALPARASLVYASCHPYCSVSRLTPDPNTAPQRRDSTERKQTPR